MISIDNIYMDYDNNEILSNISYKFDNNKIYGLIGKNGVGKTTLLKTICRLIRSNKGNLFLDDKCINSKDFLSLPITYIGDSSVYYSDLTLKEHLLLMCNIKNFSKRESINKIKSLLDTLKLEKYQYSFPDTLSKGTLQRMSIAIGIIRNEPNILMDEPFNGLDPVQVESVENLIMSEREKDKTIIVSSHDIESLNKICDVYLILKNGKLLDYVPRDLTKKNITTMIRDSYEN
ncbi:ABC transporter ATP-binding protein [Clostridium oceanicum]|uniref:ABC transporter ATP-binding protein n=1 Tax=Clostridium oceanicum TaxID=1543 RepID=A0ABP3UI93_9CLOT